VKGKRGRIVGHHFSRNIDNHPKENDTNYVDSNGNLFEDIKMY
jgi:hypothetical protein